jgi:hypothetical protein
MVHCLTFSCRCSTLQQHYNKERQAGKDAHKNKKTNEKTQQKNTNENVHNHVQEKATKAAKQIPSGI